MHRFLELFRLLGLLALVGCGSAPNMPKTHAVTGMVALSNGQPVTGAYIRFIPTDSQGSEAEAELAPDGSFTMKTTVALPGVVPAKYKVLIDPKSFPTSPENKKARAAVPTVYWSADKTPLIAEVKAEPNEFKFQVK